VGINIILEGEDGVALEQVDDPTGRLYKIMPRYEDSSFPFLRFIDLYGDTIFNRPQMEPFLDEWRRVRERAADPDARQLVAEVERLARRCQNEVHLYVRFQGE